MLKSVAVLCLVAGALGCPGPAPSAGECSENQRWDGAQCVALAPATPSISDLFAQPQVTAAAKLVFQNYLSSTSCDADGAMQIAVTTHSDNQTKALAESSALPVGEGWGLVMRTADSAIVREVCSVPFHLGMRTSYKLTSKGCSATSGSHTPEFSDEVQLSFFHTDATGKTTFVCPSHGNVGFAVTGQHPLLGTTEQTGELRVTLSAQMTNGSSIADKTFVIPKVFTVY